jgi:amino acid transporter
MPRAFLRLNKRHVPWISVVFCAVIWALALNFTFERLISIDLVLYGASLLLEFIALIVLRRREPELARPFRVPGGMSGAIAAGIGPLLLLAFAVWAARGEHVLGLNALLFATLVAISGAGVYAIERLVHQRVDSRQ